MTNQHPWVVTGAAGYLGSHVVEQLLARGTSVLAVDDLSTGKSDYLKAHSANPKFKLAQLDIRDASALSQLFQQSRPTAVIHLAALHFIPACSADPALTISLNVHGTQCVLSAAHAAHIERIWFASTGDVYVPDEKPHHEANSPTGPFNIYGLSKLMGEQLIALESRIRPDARFVVGRLFNLYGPRETNPHILPEILSQIRDNPSAPLRPGEPVAPARSRADRGCGAGSDRDSGCGSDRRNDGQPRHGCRGFHAGSARLDWRAPR